MVFVYVPSDKSGTKTSSGSNLTLEELQQAAVHSLCHQEAAEEAAVYMCQVGAFILKRDRTLYAVWTSLVLYCVVRGLHLSWGSSGGRWEGRRAGTRRWTQRRPAAGGADRWPPQTETRSSSGTEENWFLGGRSSGNSQEQEPSLTPGRGRNCTSLLLQVQAVVPGWPAGGSTGTHSATVITTT